MAPVIKEHLTIYPSAEDLALGLRLAARYAPSEGTMQKLDLAQRTSCYEAIARTYVSYLYPREDIGKLPPDHRVSQQKREFQQLIFNKTKEEITRDLEEVSSLA